MLRQVKFLIRRIILMKITKILSAVAAAAVATAAVSATAGATLTIPTGINTGLSATTGMWMVALYNSPDETTGNPGIDYGIDLTSIASISVTVTPSDPDWWDGTFGGGIITSCGPASATPADHNWPSNEYWGVLDEDLGLETLAADKPVQFVKTGDLTYTGTVTLDDSNCIYDVTSIDGGYAQVGIQEWGATMLDMTVTDLTCYDAAGNVIISFDGAGYVDSDNAAQAPAADDNTAATVDAEAPADTTAPADTAATTEKGSPDTGVEGIAAAAGVAVVAAGAVLLSKKRK